MENVYRLKVLDAIILDCCEDRLFWIFDTYEDAKIDILTKDERAKMRTCNKCGIACCKEAEE